MRIKENKGQPIFPSPLKVLLLMNTVFIFWWHPGTVFFMWMLLVQFPSNEAMLSQLYWIAPVNLLIASIPNGIVALIYLVNKQKKNLLRALLIGELYVLFIQLMLHFVLTTYLGR